MGNSRFETEDWSIPSISYQQSIATATRDIRNELTPDCIITLRCGETFTYIKHRLNENNTLYMDILTEKGNLTHGTFNLDGTLQESYSGKFDIVSITKAKE